MVCRYRYHSKHYSDSDAALELIVTPSLKMHQDNTRELLQHDPVLPSAKDVYRIFAVVALLDISNYIVYQSASVSSPSELLRGSNNATTHDAA